MCLSARHLEILRKLNERDYITRRASLETHGRFVELFERCSKCPNFDSGAFGDVEMECRQSFLRIFVSMKRDAESYLIRKKLEAQEMEHSIVTPTPMALEPTIVSPGATPAEGSLKHSESKSSEPLVPEISEKPDESGSSEEKAPVSSNEDKDAQMKLPAQWKIAHCVDASGFFCPLPIQKLSEAIQTADDDAVIQFVSTDPGTPSDLQAFCKATQHVLLDTRTDGDRFMAWVQKRTVSR